MEPDYKNPLDSGFNTGDAALTPEAVRYIHQMAPWAKFLAIMMYIFAGMALFGSLGFFFMGDNPAFEQLGMGAAQLLIGFLYIAFGVLYIFFGLWTWRYQDRAVKATVTGGGSHLAESFRNMKNMFLTAGISVIVFIVLYIVLIVFFLNVAGRGGF